MRYIIVFLLLFVFGSCMNFKKGCKLESTIKKIEVHVLPFRLKTRYKITERSFDKICKLKMTSVVEPRRGLQQLLHIKLQLVLSEFKDVGNLRIKCILHHSFNKRTIIYISNSQHIKINGRIYKPNKQLLSFLVKDFSKMYQPEAYVTKKSPSWK